MPSDIIALIVEKPQLLIVVLLVGACAGMAVERLLSKMRRQAWREKNRWRWESRRRGSNVAGGQWPPNADPVSPKQPDAADQLRIVMSAKFTVQPLLNKSETRVFKEL
jgi:hypothetical protein